MNPALKKSVRRKLAFTLLELLVAMVILVIAMSIAFQAFSGTIRGWKRGMEVMEGIQHGDFAMTQLASAFNSTIYFFNGRKTYAFQFEKDSLAGLPADTISFVTSSGAFMPPDSPFASGPHRLNLFIDDADDGYPALFASAMPAIADMEEAEEEYDAEPYLVTKAVQGLEIFVWDEELEDWTEEWEKENSVPERILIAAYVVSDDPEEEPVIFERVIQIPVSASIEDKLSSPTIQGGGKNTAARNNAPAKNTTPTQNRNPSTQISPPR